MRAHFAPKKESQGGLVLKTFKILGKQLKLPISLKLFFPYISYILLLFIFVYRVLKPLFCLKELLDSIGLNSIQIFMLNFAWELQQWSQVQPMIFQACTALISAAHSTDAGAATHDLPSQLPALGREVNGHSHRMFCSLHTAMSIYSTNQP